METPSEFVGWADLPDEIVETVFETLAVGDYIRLGLVRTSSSAEMSLLSESQF